MEPISIMILGVVMSLGMSEAAPGASLPASVGLCHQVVRPRFLILTVFDPLTDSRTFKQALGGLMDLDCPDAGLTDLHEYLSDDAEAVYLTQRVLDFGHKDSNFVLSALRFLAKHDPGRNVAHLAVGQVLHSLPFAQQAPSTLQDLLQRILTEISPYGAVIPPRPSEASPAIRYSAQELAALYTRGVSFRADQYLIRNRYSAAEIGRVFPFLLSKEPRFICGLLHGLLEGDRLGELAALFAVRSFQARLYQNPTLLGNILDQRYGSQRLRVEAVLCQSPHYQRLVIALQAPEGSDSLHRRWQRFLVRALFDSNLAEDVFRSVFETAVLLNINDEVRTEIRLYLSDETHHHYLTERLLIMNRRCPEFVTNAFRFLGVRLGF